MHRPGRRQVALAILLPWVAALAMGLVLKRGNVTGHFWIKVIIVALMFTIVSASFLYALAKSAPEPGSRNGGPDGTGEHPDHP